MTNQAEHTPTPWAIVGDFGRRVVKGKNDYTIIGIERWAKDQDAAFIVKACNEFDQNQALIAELVAALKDCGKMPHAPVECSPNPSERHARSCLTKPAPLSPKPRPRHELSRHSPNLLHPWFSKPCLLSCRNPTIKALTRRARPARAGNLTRPA